MPNTITAPVASVEELLVALASLQDIEKDAKADFEAAMKALPEFQVLTTAQRSIEDIREALRAKFTEPGQIKTSAGTVSLVAARSVEYPADAVRLFAPEVAALVIKQIPAREEVDRIALERAVKAGIKAGNLAPDTMAKLETKATIRELTPKFTIKLAEPAAPAVTSAEAAPF